MRYLEDIRNKNVIESHGFKNKKDANGRTDAYNRNKQRSFKNAC